MAAGNERQNTQIPIYRRPFYQAFEELKYGCQIRNWSMRFQFRWSRDPDLGYVTHSCSIVTSRLDYCNSLYYNMSDANVHKLQLIQNTLARVVLKLRRDEPITPALIKLHWLPVRQRINFKLATLTFKILQTHQPSYIYELIDIYEPARILRSSSQKLLISRLSRTVNASHVMRPQLYGTIYLKSYAIVIPSAFFVANLKLIYLLLSSPPSECLYE